MFINQLWTWTAWRTTPMCGGVSHATTPPCFVVRLCGIPILMWYCPLLPWCHNGSGCITGRRRRGRKKNVRTDTHTLNKNLHSVSGWTQETYSDSNFSVSASDPQNTASAPVSISANQTGEYTAAKHTAALPEPPITIVILLIYRSLGAALPPKYHTDRRGVRWESETHRTLKKISLLQLQKLLVIYARMSLIWC